MKNIVTLILCLFLSYVIKADTIPTWKVFYNSKLLKEIKQSSDIEEIKIDTIKYNSGDFIEILYDNFNPSQKFVYDIELNSESAVDLNIKYAGEKALLRTENQVELFFDRVNDKNKAIRFDLKWVMDWLKEYPQYRIEVKLVERNYEEKKYNSIILFYIVNK